MQVSPAIVVIYVARPLAGGGHEVLQLLRRESSYMGGTWQFPGGRIEPGERATDAAPRELFEETGLTPRVFSHLSYVPTFFLPKHDLIGMGAAFCAIVDADDEPRLNEEHTGFRWITRGEVRRKVLWPTDRAALAEVFREHLGVPNREPYAAQAFRLLPVPRPAKDHLE